VRRTFHLLVALYMVGLVLAAWPWERPAWLVPVHDRADAWLNRVTLRPGLAVFEHSDRRWKVQGDCYLVVGVHQNAPPDTLYERECPPAGFQWRKEPFTAYMQFATGIDPWTSLVRQRGSALPRPMPEIFRRMILMGQYFCHSPLAGSGDYEGVELTRFRYMQHFEDGRRQLSPVRCRWICSEQQAAIPA